jgi:hypothetical protein
VMGSSTGGTRVPPMIFRELPVLRACALIVQHMPRFINSSFVSTLGQHSPMPVQLAEVGAGLTPGRVPIAPSEVHAAQIRALLASWPSDRSGGGGLAQRGALAGKASASLSSLSAVSCRSEIH